LEKGLIPYNGIVIKEDIMLEEIKLPIIRNGSEIIVTLLSGGEKFPWADIGGKVFIGPPSKALVSGLPAWFLKWRKSLYWVFEAEDEWGDCTELTPKEYEKAVKRAETIAFACLLGAAI